ncbi:hypothetical protein BMS3Bbin06_01279 [bacterium BMS3Bbin06]|nr:hypothetical protein BMS3Abin08_02428 [bacterium BMS3Abin08]GBE34749.1 hypothetical protein BMS3Bbin06_01279 [bacterium BMS3Bbin06]
MNKPLMDDNRCFVCGRANLFGLWIEFSVSHGRATAGFLAWKVS